MLRVRAFADPESLSFVAKFFIVFAIAYAFVVTVAFYFILGEWRTYAQSTVSTVSIANNGSITETCEILNCAYFDVDGVRVYHQKNGEYTELAHKNVGFTDLIEDLLVIPVETKDHSVTLGLSVRSLCTFYTNTILTLYVFLMVLSLIFLMRYLISSNIKSLKDGASNTASLHNKNMSMLAEQLHHELNTPLSVVKELCDKVFSNMEVASTCNRVDKGSSPCTSCTMPEKFAEMSNFKRIIDNNIRQAFVFIERMADVKQIRYSNGNKSIYDIAKATFDIMGVYNRTNYTYDIDVSLRNYRIDHGSGLKNHELMNILVNHIKNSLEAGSCHIVVSLNKVVHYKMNRLDRSLAKAIDFLSTHDLGVGTPLAIVILYKFMSTKARHNTKLARVALIDNGTGIPEEFQSKIFNLNSSTKKKNGVIRGAGLYLNREILRDSRGDLWLHKTNKTGTTFILDVPCEQVPSRFA